MLAENEFVLVETFGMSLMTPVLFSGLCSNGLFFELGCDGVFVPTDAFGFAISLAFSCSISRALLRSASIELSATTSFRSHSIGSLVFRVPFIKPTPALAVSPSFWTSSSLFDESEPESDPGEAG
jgi:hypothetical protein